MSTATLKILLISEDEAEYLTIKRLVAGFKHREATVDWCATYETGVSAVARGEHELCLVDYKIGQHTGVELTQDKRIRMAEVPKILLIDFGHLDAEMTAFESGFFDCLLINQLSIRKLERSIRFAIEHTRTLAALREVARNNSLFTAAIDHSTTGVVVTDPNQEDNPIVFVNNAFSKITGYKAEEVIGRNCRFLQGPETDRQMVAQMRDALQNAQPFRGLLFNYQADGTPFWNGLSINPVFDENKHLVNFIGLINDVTARVSAEKAVQKSERRFRALMEHSSDIISLLNQDGEILYQSPSILRLFGYAPESFNKRCVFDYVHPADVPTLRKALKENQVFNITIRFQTAGGEWRWIEARGSNLLADPDVQAIVVNSRDVTERKRDEEQLERSREQLRELAAQLTSVREEERKGIAREVHDVLGQALTGIKMDLAWLDRRLGEGEVESTNSLRPKLLSMCAQVDSTIRTVQEISSQLRPSLLDDLGLEAAIEWKIQQFQERTGIRCEFICTVDEIQLPAESLLSMFRIFEEAMTNIARHAGATEVVVILEENQGYVVLELQDNGRGIREEEISTTKSLGVVGMQERALRSGGEIKITNAIPRGTIVTARLPLGMEETHEPRRQEA